MPRVPVLLLLLACGVAGVVAGPAQAGADGRPARVVSLNLCSDQLVLQLLERERIASISFIGADPRYSAMAEQARGLHRNHGLAEEVLRLDPDLVFAGTYTSRATVALLRRLGFRVVEFPPPRDIPTVRAQMRKAAQVLGVPERGEALIARFDRKLRAAAPRDQENPPAAVVYEANGITLGPGELAHAVIEAAGLRNLADELGLRGPARLPLERLLVGRPDVLVLHGDGRASPSQATELLHHPALRHLRERTRVAYIPQALWSCGGAHLAEAVARLARARRDIRREDAGARPHGSLRDPADTRYPPPPWRGRSAASAAGWGCPAPSGETAKPLSNARWHRPADRTVQRGTAATRTGRVIPTRTRRRASGRPHQGGGGGGAAQPGGTCGYARNAGALEDG